jgi:hypothetical protein
VPGFDSSSTIPMPFDDDTALAPVVRMNQGVDQRLSNRLMNDGVVVPLEQARFLGFANRKGILRSATSRG